MGTTLVGRDDALAEARDRLRRERLAVVVGASGIGKSALLDATAARWRADGSAVVELRGTIGLRSVDFGALIPLLPEETLGASATGIAAAIATELRSLPDSALVVVDDAHLLDDAGAGLLTSLLPSGGFAIALAMTSGEPPPADLQDLRVRRPDCVVQLEPLGPEAVAVMAGGLLGDDLPAADVEQLYRITLGYPLYVSALARETAAGSPWSTDRLAALMERRLARLDRAHRELFDVVAFAEDLPAAVAEHVDAEGFDTLQRLDVVRVAGGRVAPAHPLLASVAHATLTRDGLRRCATVLLGALGRCGPADANRLTRAALAVGVVPEGEALTSAATAAISVGDYRTAADLTAHDPADPRLAALRAEALRFLGEVPDEPPTDLDDEALVEYLSQRAQALAFAERRYQDATKVLADGLDRVTAPALRTRLGLELMTLSGLVGDLDGLVHSARSIGEDADDDTRLLAAATQLLAEGLTLSMQHPDETYAEALRLVGDGAGDPLMVDRLEMSRALVDLADGRFGDARRRFDGDRVATGPWLTIESLLADAWLPLDEAERIAADAVAALEAFDPLGNLSQAQALLALRRAQRGLDIGTTAAPSEDPGVAAIEAAMAARVEAWTRRSAPDLADLGRRSLEMGHRLWGLCCLVDAVRLGAGRDVAPDIEQLAVAGGVGLAHVAAHHARATDRAGHWAAARAWWEAGAPTYAIEAAAGAADTPADRAGLQLLAARGATPVVGGPPPEAPWTDRQVDVLFEALRGASNQEIADALFISRRTVENHLHAAYSAADIDGRDDLVERFGWLAG